MNKNHIIYNFNNGELKVTGYYHEIAVGQPEAVYEFSGV
jgi:hypothetical protein